VIAAEAAASPARARFRRSEGVGARASRNARDCEPQLAVPDDLPDGARKGELPRGPREHPRAAVEVRGDPAEREHSGVRAEGAAADPGAGEKRPEVLPTEQGARDVRAGLARLPRIQSQPAAPPPSPSAPKPRVPAPPDFSCVLDFSAPGSLAGVRAVLESLDAVMKRQRSELDEILEESASTESRAHDMCDELHTLSPDGLDQVRRSGVISVLCYRAVVRRCQRAIAVLQGNIQAIDAFQDALRGLQGGERGPAVNLNGFTDRFVPGIGEVGAKIQRLAAHGARIGALESASRPPEMERVIEQALTNVGEMDCRDLAEIMGRLAPSPGDFLAVRALVFDMTWQRVWFPFSDTRPMKLPPIFDLCPRIFQPAYLTEPFVSTPFQDLNVIEWPGIVVMESFFMILVQRDPFKIGDMLWDAI